MAAWRTRLSAFGFQLSAVGIQAPGTAAWRSLALAVILLGLAGRSAAADKVVLTDKLKEGDCFKVRLEMTFKGEIKVTRDDKPAKLPISATATHEYPERILAVDAAGLAEKTARVYETARATVTAGDDKSDKTLRKERRLFVAQRPKDLALVYSPAGPLTREEIELTAEHFDTLCLTGLLPDKEVAAGDTWKIASSVVQTLCHFEGLTEQDLTAKLEAVGDRAARIVITGTASGIELGALVKLKIDAAGTYDLAARRLTDLEWKQTDERDQGPASPAMTSESTTTVKRTPIEQPEVLADVALVSVPQDYKVPGPMASVEYVDPRGRYEVVHAREWQVVGTPQGRLVLRLMERGDFVAQATITPWTPAAKGEHLSPEAFREAMAGTPGWQADKEIQAGEVPSGDGRWIYRISALGKMDGIPVMQNFYLIASPAGEQVVAAVTLTPKKADQLGSRDLTLAGSIDFPTARKAKE